MHIVLVNPEIPQNTGSIARTCAALGIPLHLIEPLGFEINEKRVRRAGLDYWPYVDLTIHPDWQTYLDSCQPNQIWALTKFGSKRYCDAEFSKNDALVFGSETKGLGEEFLKNINPTNQLVIPMLNKNVRSLNLSNAVSIVAYEASKCLGVI